MGILECTQKLAELAKSGHFTKLTTSKTAKNMRIHLSSNQSVGGGN